MTRTITAHPEMEMGLAGPCCADRQWFHENPEAVVRFRPLLPDELEVQTAVCRMLGAGGPPALNITGDDGHHLPLTYAVVVDLLRLTGTPHGPDGESGRLRLCCPEPASEEMQDALAMEALRWALLMAPRKPKPRRGGLGFG